MKVYYVNSGLQGCFVVRCLLPLSANGWDGDQTSIRLDSKTPENKAKAASNSDIVVFHRPEDKQKLELARTIKKHGKKIVFDNDDTYKDDGGFKFNEYMNKERLEKGLKTLNESIDTFIQEADLVTCSTEFLAEEYRKINDNVIVLPNCVDPFYYDEPIKNKTNKVRIGLTGSIGVTSDFDVAKPIIEHFKDRDDVTIVLFSLPPAQHDQKTRELYHNEYIELDKMMKYSNVEWQPFVMMEEYYDRLNELALDIMIIPRADNYFNRCKSNLKFLEASMFEIPCICQSFPDGKSPYEANEADIDNLILATNTEDWITKIEDLIKDKEKREALGKRAKEYVLENYNIETKGYLWGEAYKTLL